jgi:undecaprenyl-diphosphatase
MSLPSAAAYGHHDSCARDSGEGQDVQDVIEWTVNTISAMDPTTVYVVIGLLAFLEAAALIGLFVPGETALLLGGILAAQGRVSLVGLIVVAVVAAILGDAVGYEIGRRWGSRLLASRLLRRRAATVQRASAAMVRWGGAVVFVGRWVGGTRACVPALAGMTRMPYRTFAFSNVLGGITWAAGARRWLPIRCPVTPVGCLVDAEESR